MFIKIFLPLILGLASLVGIGELIHGCVNSSTGAIRIVINATCAEGETLLEWNTVGPQGPAGPQGVEGKEGPKGDPGDDADVTALSAQVTTLQGQVTTSLGQLAASQGQVTTLQNEVSALKAKLVHVTTAGPDITIAGANLRVVTGTVDTDAPVHQLSIAGGPAWTTSFWKGAVDLNNGSAIGWRANESGYNFGMGHTNGGFYIFRTASAPGTNGSPASYDLSINDSGHVGIGNDHPEYPLHVAGSTWIEGGNLYVTGGAIYVGGQEMTVPDYVFEADYPLMPLDELRAYLAVEKHLPNVPDAEQIAQGGLNLTEFQMKLLEKTEELTLYTLAQDEQHQLQQQEIESLQQENQTQDKQLDAMQQLIEEMEARVEALEEQQ